MSEGSVMWKSNVRYHILLAKFSLQASQPFEFDAQFEGTENRIGGGKSDQRRAWKSSVCVDSRHGMTQRILKYASNAVVASTPKSSEIYVESITYSLIRLQKGIQLLNVVRSGYSCSAIQQNFQDFVVITVGGQNQWCDIRSEGRGRTVNILPALSTFHREIKQLLNCRDPIVLIYWREPLGSAKCLVTRVR